MPFTAPYAQSQVGPITLPFRFPWDPAPTDAAPSQTPEDIAAAQKAADAALLAKLNLPAGWTVVGHADASSVDSKGKPQDVGNTAVTVAGPNGEQGQMILDPNGNVAFGGELKVNADPKAPAPVVPHETQAQIDQAAADAHAKATAGTPARADTPAETQNANTASQNANTSAAAQANTAAHDANADANAKRLADLQAARDAADVSLKQAEQAYNDRKLAADTDYQNGKLSQDQWISERNAAHQEAQDAVSASEAANQKYTAEQNAQFQQGQLANQTTQNAEASRHNAAVEGETSRSNQASEANNAATLLERTNADKQASEDRLAQTNADLVQKRGELASGHLNNWVNAAAGSKNFGLGGAIPSNMAAGLMSDANTSATNEMGGQSFMDKATQMVHQANPALAGTPEGAQYASVAAQMLEKSSTPAMTAPSADSTANSNTAAALAPPGVAGTVSPSDPRFLGTVIGQAVSHLNNSQLSPDSQFTAPSTTSGSFTQSDIPEGSR